MVDKSALGAVGEPFELVVERAVFPGDVLTLSGSVVRLYEEGGERRADLDLVCTRQDGAVAVLAWATFRVDEMEDA